MAVMGLEGGLEVVDARVRRTRHLLHEALAGLLATKSFDRISVQEIAEAATVNRVTFYDHYADKYLLLSDMVAAQFDALLARRGIGFDGGCASALTGLVVAVCDMLASTPRAECPESPIEPHMESALIEVLRRMVRQGIELHPPAGDVSKEMLAATVCWAIYGGAREWVRTPARSPVEEAAATIVRLVTPMMAAGASSR